MAWTFIGRLVAGKIKLLGVEPFFKFTQLKNNWEEILEGAVGEKFKNKSRPVGFKNNVLTVDCLNSVWANEFKLREFRVLEEIRKKQKQIKIEKIVFIC